MTDDDLIQLLAEKSPREFSPEELTALQVRVRESQAVRQAVLSAVEFESQLSAAFGAVGINIDKLWQQAELRPVDRQRSATWWWGLVGLTACVLAAWLLWPAAQPAQNGPAGIADHAATSAETSVPPPVTKVISAANSGDSARTVDHARSQSVETAAADPKMSATATPVGVPAEPVASIPEGPWSAWTGPTAVPLAVNDPRNIGDLRSMGLDQLTLAEFQEWWGPIAGQQANQHQDKIGNRPTLNLDGWWSLSAPWLADTHLRMTPFDVRDLTLYFWQGQEGVALKFYREREPHVWAAFQVRRQPGEVQPSRWGLLTTDSGAYYRSGAATWDLCRHDGRLLLSVGGIVILGVPLPFEPAEVVLHTQTRLRGFQWVRAEPPTELAQVSGDNLLTGERPADAAWETTSAETAMLQRDVDGGMRLTSTDNQQVVRAFFPLATPGLFETLVQVSEADPGTGIFLGNEAGQPIGCLSFCRDRKSQQLTVVGLPGYEKRMESDYEFRAFPPPYFLPDNWFRVSTGLGTWQTWCSADRRHWGRLAENPVRGVPGAVRTVGLFCLPGETPRTIRLQGLEVRRLPGFQPLVADVPAESLPTIDLKQTRQIGEWLAAGWPQASASKVSAKLWHDTWAVRTLEQGPAPELAQALVERLVESSERLDTAERLQFLNDVLALCDSWPEDRARRWERAYAELLADPSEPNVPFSTRDMWGHWLRAPLWSNHRGHQAFDQRRVRELLTHAYAGQGVLLAELSRQNYYWTEPAHPDQSPRDSAAAVFQLARWGRSIAVDLLGVAATLHHEALPIGWRHPWSMQLNKEAYNVQAELLSALESQSYGDACRIISGINAGAMSGLLPDDHDPDLFLTLPVALQTAKQAHPELARRIPEELGPTGDLRWQLAASRGDAAAMGAAAVQFWGTPAAARAHAWLGDRAISLGDPVSALVSYRSAMLTADAELQNRLTPRQQLAQQALGLPIQEPAESLPLEGVAVSELWATSTVDSPMTPPLSTLVPDLPLVSTRYHWQKLARFDGQSGQNAGRGEYQDGNAFGRQFAVAADAQRVYLSNRFQITAYQRESGSQVWARGVDQDQGEAHAFAFTPMTPVVAGERIYARRLTKAGIELACLNALDGQIVWTMRPGEKSHVLSDPLVIGPNVWVLTAIPGEQDHWDIAWTRLQRENGQQLSAVPLLRLRAAWDQELPATVTTDGLETIANIGSVILRFDLAGNVHWVRRELWLPPKIDPLENNHFLAAPVILGPRIYLSPLNSRRVLCLDRETGREIWSTTCADSQGLLAAKESGVLIAEPTGLSLLDAATGTLRWQHQGGHPCHAVAWHDSTISALRPLVRKDRRGWLQLTEWNAETGEVLQEIPWDVDEGDDYRVGPWFEVGDDIWLLVGQGFREAHRDLVKLTPTTAVTAATWNDAAFGPWQTAWPTDIRRDVQLQLPGWQAYGLEPNRISRQTGEVRGVTSVLLTKLEKADTFRLVRSLPLQQKSVCRLLVGHEPSQRWKLSVLVAGQVIHTAEVSASHSQNSWLTLEIPLPELTEAATVIEVRAEAIEGQPATALWKTLSLSPVKTNSGTP